MFLPRLGHQQRRQTRTAEADLRQAQGRIADDHRWRPAHLLAMFNHPLQQDLA